MNTIAILQTMFVCAAVSAQQTPTTGYAPVNGLKMYYEVHGSGEPVVLDAFPQLTAEAFKGTPVETGYKKLSPTPDEFPNFVKRVVARAVKPYDFGADKLRATKAPMFFIHGDADGVRLEHISEMFRLKGGEIFGDMRPRSASRLAILPDTTHVTLMDRMPVIVPMVNDFFDAKPQKQ